MNSLHENSIKNGKCCFYDSMTNMKTLDSKKKKDKWKIHAKIFLFITLTI